MLNRKLISSFPSVSDKAFGEENIGIESTSHGLERSGKSAKEKSTVMKNSNKTNPELWPFTPGH